MYLRLAVFQMTESWWLGNEAEIIHSSAPSGGVLIAYVVARQAGVQIAFPTPTLSPPPPYIPWSRDQGLNIQSDWLIFLKLK